jgi:transcriptional regulator with XRE-family HTH domain
MPRPNAPRTIASESNVAQRIILERERRGLSYDALAKLMTDAGCSLAGTAIFRIEKGDPPRRITVDELVAFAKVFDTAPDDLLAPVEVARKKRGRELAEKTFRALEELPRSVHLLAESVAEVRALSEDDPAVYEYFQHQWDRESKQLTAYSLTPIVAEKLGALVEAVIGVHSRPGAHPAKMPAGGRQRAFGKQLGKVRA